MPPLPCDTMTFLCRGGRYPARQQPQAAEKIHRLYKILANFVHGRHLCRPYCVLWGYSMPYPIRKSPRIPHYDYSANNYYFITICTHEKRCIFGMPDTLTPYGLIAMDCLRDIPSHFTQVRLDQFVVMPNHIHAILVLDTGCNAKVSTIVSGYKAAVSRRIHETIPQIQVWQRSFHDHVIRNQQSYEKIWTYVRYNGQKWSDDRFYVPNPR